MTYLPMLDRPARIDRLKRMARIMCMVTTVGIGVVAILTVAGLLIPDFTRDLLVLFNFVGTNDKLPVTASARLTIAIIIAVPVGAILFGLFAVRAMFAEFARGHVFTVRSARCLQIFAATVLAQAPLGPLTTLALSIALALDEPPGQSWSIAFSLDNLFALIIGGVLYAAATVMREAARIADENASFV
jgi:Protein of unknown function (DUF2975)